jgi:hypothetical protein
MAKRKDKNADRVRHLFDQVNGASRVKWERINQKGFDFANDNQLTEEEQRHLSEQGMPDFTINRIMPVVEMLNFYATANTPRWQAVGVDASDTDVAHVFSDVADYIWDLSDGATLFANAVNDSITKSIGYLLVTVDPDSDNGMGDVVIKQPEPFDIFVDPKSRDILFKDAAFVMIRKILPVSHLEQMFPSMVRKIRKASSNQQTEYNYTEKSLKMQKDFTYKDISESESYDPSNGENDNLLELFETYEKVKIGYVNVFYRMPPNEDQIAQVQQQVKVQLSEMKAEMEVGILEQQQRMQMAVEAGEMLPQRFELEMQKAVKNMETQLAAAEQQMISDLQAEISQIENKVVSEKEFKIMSQDPTFSKMIVDTATFYGNRIKLSCVVGDVTLYEKVLPEQITEYPIVPFHFKWTGTPFPISAVSPLIGKQREMNKAHQLMIHNASLGSSLRWLHEEGSIDTDYWEQYSSAPGALLPVRPGAMAPTPVQPAPLSNAFFGIVNEGKQDMEYLAGIYGAMQGDTSAQHETYRGMLAMDEYGTRRVKQWMKNSIEPALKRLGQVVAQYSQATYTGHKVFRVVQPNNISEEKQVEINVPMYNDLGEAIGKFNDYGSSKFDIRVISGSTLPINRWAYLDELKQYMQMGVIDDIALLSETDIKNKESIVKRKSMYSQMQQQIQQLEEQLKNSQGTVETLERQVVQAGIKGKIQAAETELSKKKYQIGSEMDKEHNETKAQQKHLRNTRKLESDMEQKNFKNSLQNIIKDLEKSKEDS